MLFSRREKGGERKSDACWIITGMQTERNNKYRLLGFTRECNGCSHVFTRVPMTDVHRDECDSAISNAVAHSASSMRVDRLQSFLVGGTLILLPVIQIFFHFLLSRMINGIFHL